MSTKRRSNVVLNKNKIIESIIKSEPSGRHTLMIAEDTKLHRDTVSRLCTELENDYYINRKNKQAEYHLTPKLYGEPSKQSFLFQSEAMRNISELEWTSSSSKFCNTQFYNKIVDIINATQDKTLLDQLTLFEFANRITAVILYTMIEAMRPTDNSSLKLSKDRLNLKGKVRDKSARLWIQSINPDRIFWEFVRLDIVKRGRAINTIPLERYKQIKIKSAKDEKRVLKLKRQEIIDSLTEEERKELEQNPEFKKGFDAWLDQQLNKLRLYSPYNPEWSFYEMDEDNFKKLTESFSSIYPEIYKKLEDIRSGLGRKIDTYRKLRKEHLLGKKKKEMITSTIR